MYHVLYIYYNITYTVHDDTYNIMYMYHVLYIYYILKSSTTRDASECMIVAAEVELGLLGRSDDGTGAMCAPVWSDLQVLVTTCRHFGVAPIWGSGSPYCGYQDGVRRLGECVAGTYGVV